MATPLAALAIWVCALFALKWVHMRRHQQREQTAGVGDSDGVQRVKS